MKKYILIAGVNGAGKSTLYQTFESLASMPRINSDEIVRSFGDWRNMDDVVKAGKMAVKKIAEYFEQGITFNQETTLCGTSIIRNIKTAKALGYQVELHYVGVDSVNIAKKRIAYRVSQGGHSIPDADVERRYAESLKKLKEILGICDIVILYDNTRVFKRFAIYKEGKLCSLTAECPQWYKKWELQYDTEEKTDSILCGAICERGAKEAEKSAPGFGYDAEDRKSEEDFQECKIVRNQ